MTYRWLSLYFLNAGCHYLLGDIGGGFLTNFPVNTREKRNIIEYRTIVMMSKTVIIKKNFFVVFIV